MLLAAALLPGRGDPVASPCARPVASVRAAQRVRARLADPDRSARRLRRRRPRCAAGLQPPAGDVRLRSRGRVRGRRARRLSLATADAGVRHRPLGRVRRAEPGAALAAGRRRNRVPAARRPRARPAVGPLHRGPRDPDRRAGREASRWACTGCRGRSPHSADRDQRAREAARAACRAAAGVGRVQIPASVGQLLEVPAGRAGRDAIGLAARVPHYLALIEYPAAAVALLTTPSRASPTSTSGSSRRGDARNGGRAEIDDQVRTTSNRAAVIRSLEESYDELEREGTGSAGETLPTGDELGAAFERFLAERSTAGRGRGGPLGPDGAVGARK